MNTRRGYSKRGFTLTEILVVIAIVSLLAGLAVAGVARLKAGAKQEMDRSVRHVYTLLNAAKIYASTYRVNTAVVYNLDNYVSPPLNEITAPVVDSVTGQMVRVIREAAVMYQLPNRAEYPATWKDTYVPIPGDLGNFAQFEGEQVISLFDPTKPFGAPNSVFYAGDAARYDPQTRFEPGRPRNNIEELGMDVVNVILNATGPFTSPENPAFPNQPNPDYLSPTVAPFLAHVYNSSGRLMPLGGARERYTLYITPPPNNSLDELLVDPQNEAGERVSRSLQLYRSTGRIKTPT